MILEQEVSPDVLDDKHKGTSGINIGGNTVTQATEHMEEDQKLLIRWLHTWARDHKWQWPDMVGEVGFSSTTWYRIFTDKYRYPKDDPRAGQRIPIDSQCSAIAKYKRTAEARAAVASAGFVETSVWKRVDWICRRTFVRQKLGFIYGESQIGKTTCLLEHARRNNSGQTRYVEMPPAAGVQLMTRCIAKALNVHSKTCFEHLIDDVIDALDESKLLIVDEIHRVFTTYQKTSVMRCMDVLRYIHDKTKCGMVLCGTNVFRDQLRAGEFFQYLKQLRRRGLYELQLPTVPPRDDLDIVASKFGLKPAEGEAEEILQHIAVTDGFGKYIIRLQDASELATNRREKIGWEHFVKAHNIIEKMAMEADQKGKKS